MSHTKDGKKLVIDLGPMKHVTLEQCIQEQKKKESVHRNSKEQIDEEKQPEKNNITSSDGEEIHISYKPEDQLERAVWGGKIDFILTCVSFAVGLGNVWRFPYLVYKNGGGAFLIPYVLMLALVGLPVFFMEFAFGQFSSCSPIMCWKISPLFKGIGYGMIIICTYLIIYYNVIISHAVFYLVSSFNTKLPWERCGNWWNDNTTCYDGTNLTEHVLNNPAINKTYTPAEQYYYKYALEISDGMENFGLPSWKLTLCLLLSWVIVAIVLIKGVQSLGKISYFTSLFPYIMLTTLLIRGCFLDGSLKGIKYYLSPKWHKLKEASVWTDAATQIFYSLGICNGPLINLASFNKFRNNCCRDAIIVAIINCSTSVFAGFVVFINLGFMSVTKNVTIDKVAKEGPGLAFVVYPEAISQMPCSPFWAIAFFLMLVTLGYGSQLSMVECVISAMQDVLVEKQILRTTLSAKLFRVGVCAVCFLLGLPMVCNGGIYLLTLVDWAVASYPLLIVGLLEILVICYFYGIDQFCQDINLMTGSVPNIYWRLTWRFISPGVMIGLILFYFIASTELKYANYRYPYEWRVVAQLIAVLPILCVPIHFFYRYCKDGGYILFLEYKKPHTTWGPAEEENRHEFLEMIRSTDSVRIQNNVILEESDNYLGNNTGGGDDFFQSRQSIISKLTKAAADKEAAFNSKVDLQMNSTLQLQNNGDEDEKLLNKTNVNQSENENNENKEKDKDNNKETTKQS